MPAIAPTYKGDFPVKTREETRYLDKGKLEYIVTNVYRSNNIVTGTIGSLLNRDNIFFSLTNISISTKNGLSEITHTYTGGDSTAPEIYEVVASLFEEPIASHIAFTASTGIFALSIVTACGGAITQGQTGSGGAIFDEAGGFIKFSKSATGNFFGVQSFLSPQVSYRRIYSLGLAPTTTLSKLVGTIFSEPEGKPPEIPSGRNWLLTSMTWKNNGNQRTESGQYEITEEYKSSGLKGWNNGIYYTTN